MDAEATTVPSVTSKEVEVFSTNRLYLIRHNIIYTYYNIGIIGGINEITENINPDVGHSVCDE